MAQTTGISWTDATWNVAVGCDKVSEGCEFCYMMRDGERFSRDWNGTVTKTKSVFTAPLKWKAQKAALQKKYRNAPLPEKEAKRLVELEAIEKIFTSSLTDVFHPQIDGFRSEVYEIIKQCPEFKFQVLTKRIERVKENLPPDWGNGYPNVWLMATCENQDRWDERIPILQSIPAQIRGVSIEPILSGINILPMLKRAGNGKPLIDWIILGGESGNDNGKWRYRKSRLEWYMDIVLQATEVGIPVFVKQLGTHLAKKLSLADRHGADIAEFPKSLQVREFPKL
jgi:protein gp37